MDCLTGGNGAAARIGLGNVAKPYIFECDTDLIVVDKTIPPPMVLELSPASVTAIFFSGIDVISTVVHSRPLAKKTRLVMDLINLVMYSSADGSDERS